MQWRWVASEVFTMSQHSCMVRAAGTSTATCLPAFMAATAMGTCQTHGVATTTRSRSSRATSFSKAWSPSVYRPGAFGSFPARSSRATVRCTFSGTTSHRAATCTSGMAEKFWISELPRPPVPMKPILTLDFGSNFKSQTGLFWGGAASAKCAPAAASVAMRSRSRRDVFLKSTITSRDA